MPTAAALMGGTSILGAITSRNATKKASNAQDRANEMAVKESRRAVAQAKASAVPLFEQGARDAQAGFQGALDIYGQSAPMQAGLFQQGNVGAQNAILAGLPQMQNAILGGNVDLSQMKAFEMQQPNFDFLNQQTPVIARQQQEQQQAQHQMEQQQAQQAQQVAEQQAAAQARQAAEQQAQVNMFGNNYDPVANMGMGTSPLSGQVASRNNNALMQVNAQKQWDRIRAENLARASSGIMGFTN